MGNAYESEVALVMADKMQVAVGGTTITFTPRTDPAFVRPDSRNRGHFQASDATRQLWDTGGAHRGAFTLNDISLSDADQLNAWWRALSVVTYTPNTDDPGTTIHARISPAGQKPFQMWFDTGHQNRYVGTITIVEVSSSSSSSG